MKSKKTIANALLAQGFDQTYIRGDSVYPVCSQCEALVIQGIVTHENGCPNVVHECHGCNNPVSKNQRYCSDCA